MRLHSSSARSVGPSTKAAHLSTKTPAVKPSVVIRPEWRIRPQVADPDAGEDEVRREPLPRPAGGQRDDEALDVVAERVPDHRGLRARRAQRERRTLHAPPAGELAPRAGGAVVLI